MFYYKKCCLQKKTKENKTKEAKQKKQKYLIGDFIYVYCGINIFDRCLIAIVKLQKILFIIFVKTVNS